MAAIVAERLNKTYEGGVHALKDLDLSVERGTIFGFLGPNGSGKTTTVRLLNGTLSPTAGSASVLGLPPTDEVIRMRTSTLAELARMYESLTVLENLTFFAGLYGIDGGRAQDRIRSLLSTFDLWDKRDLKLGSFSTGMQKRAYLARTLVNDPEILFLDEPTSGLDPDSALQVMELIHSLAKEKGRTVFLCTHNLALAERICDGCGFIHQGVLVAVGTREELTRAVIDKNRVRIVTSVDSYEFELGSENEINGHIQELMGRGEHIRDVHIEIPDLETVYFHYIRRQANGRP
jgi:ABC-2 type transport system ATP-binding protein